MSATIERRFHLANQGHRRGGFHRAVRPGDEPVDPRPPAPPAPSVEQVHPLARRMAMAIRCEQLIASGVASDQASLAAAAGMTRAWVTVVMRLTLLAPDIQEALLTLAPETVVDHRAVQRVATQTAWTRQRVAWRQISTTGGLRVGVLALRMPRNPHEVRRTKPTAQPERVAVRSHDQGPGAVGAGSGGRPLGW